MVIALQRGPVFCGAPLKNAQNGETCRNGSGKATDHPGYGRCKWHGGNSPTHRNAAQIQQARATAQLFGVPREADPIAGMLETYHQTLGILDAIEAMCMRLLPDEVGWGVVKEKRVGDGEDGGEGEGLTPVEREYGPGVNIWVKLLAEWHDRAFKEAEAMLKLGLDQRRVEIAASQVAAIITILLSPDLGLSEDQRRVAARLLRQMQSEAIEGTAAAS
jgi:hypothetical protein